MASSLGINITSMVDIVEKLEKGGASVSSEVFWIPINTNRKNVPFHLYRVVKREKQLMQFVNTWKTVFNCEGSSRNRLQKLIGSCVLEFWKDPISRSLFLLLIHLNYYRFSMYAMTKILYILNVLSDVPLLH